MFRTAGSCAEGRGQQVPAAGSGMVQGGRNPPSDYDVPNDLCGQRPHNETPRRVWVEGMGVAHTWTDLVRAQAAHKITRSEISETN